MSPLGLSALVSDYTKRLTQLNKTKAATTISDSMGKSNLFIYFMRIDVLHVCISAYHVLA